MNLTKITIIILYIGIVLTAGLILIKDSGSNKKDLAEKTILNKALSESSIKKSPITNESPLTWVRNATSDAQINQKERDLSPALENLSESFSKFFNEINLSTSTFFQSNQPTTKLLPPRLEEVEVVENYYKNFIEALNRANLTSEEWSLIARTDENRILLLEELIEKAEQGEDLERLKKSFYAWHQLGKRILIELNNLSPIPKTLLFHQAVTDWLVYYSEVAQQFSEKNLSPSQINQLAQEFKTRAEIHVLRLKQGLEASNKSKKIFTSFDFRAQAVTCGATVPPPFYHFGGRVRWIIPYCAIGVEPGMVVNISQPCGGSIYFSSKVLVFNPYLWKAINIDAYVLGRSTLSPGGVCFVGVCPKCISYYFDAVAVFFGSSLSPKN